MMDVNEVIAAYVEKFGGWPMFLFMSADDEFIVEKLQEAIDNGMPISAEDDVVY